YAAMRALEVWVALGRGGVPPRRRPLYFLAVVAVVPVDVVATAAAVVAHVRRRPHGWDTAR
ncbi:MAG: hypothetical protein ACJ74C_09515, partial [Gaiellaceae bacterium]